MLRPQGFLVGQLNKDVLYNSYINKVSIITSLKPIISSYILNTTADNIRSSKCQIILKVLNALFKSHSPII